MDDYFAIFDFFSTFANKTIIRNKMKKILLLLSLIAVDVHAQDIIVKKDGNTVVSKVLEVNTSEVKYKKFSNLDGPTYIISKAELLSINYENGDRDVFEDTAPNSEPASNQAPVTDEQRNKELVALYNREYPAGEKLGELKNKAASECIFVMGASPTSTFANSEIELSLVKCKSEMPQGEWGTNEVYYILMKNKTDRVIYIDKALCYRVTNGLSKSMYEDTKQVTVSKGTSSSLGIGTNIGPIGVGGSSGSSTIASTSFNNVQYIEIPPHSMRYFSEDRWTFLNGIGNNRKYKKVESGELFLFAPKFSPDNSYFKYSSLVKLKKGDIKKGEVKIFNEQESPFTQEYIITYSFDQAMTQKNSVNAKFYLHQIGGVGTGWVSWQYIEGFFDGSDEYSILGFLRF